MDSKNSEENLNNSQENTITQQDNSDLQINQPYQTLQPQQNQGQKPEPIEPDYPDLDQENLLHQQAENQNPKPKEKEKKFKEDELIQTNYPQQPDQKQQKPPQNNNNNLNINLPKLKKFNFRAQNYKKKKSVPESLLRGIESIEQYFDENLEIWDITHNSNFEFNLPSTDFIGNQPLISYQQPTYEVEKLEIGQLSKEQLNSIWLTSSFEVPSVKFSTPYVWKLTNWLIKGRQNIQNSLHWDLSKVFRVLKHWQLYLYNHYKKDQNEQGYIKSIFEPQLLDGLKEIFLRFPLRLFDLFIGKPWNQSHDLLPIVQTELEKQRNLKIIKDKAFDQFKNELTHFMSILNSAQWTQIKKNLVLLETEFLKEKWNKGLKEKLEKDLNIENQIELEEKLENIKHRLFYQYIEEKKPEYMQDPSYSFLIRYIKAYRIITKQQDIFEKKVAEYDLEIQSKIEKQHYIKAKSGVWLTEKLSELKEANKKQLLQERDLKIVEELEKFDLTAQLFMYQQLLSFEENLEKHKKKIKKDYLKKNQKPQKTFHWYTDYPVQEIVKDKKTNRYQVKYNDSHPIESKVFFRVSLFLQRYFCICKSLYLFIKFGLSTSQISLKGLFSCKEYQYQKQLINSDTGETKLTGEKIKPIKVKFSENLKQIKENRTKFEQIPDNAFFGKGTGRVCNYLSNYLCRFILYGIFWLLIFLPILALTAQTLMILIFLTIWFWPFLVLILGSLWQWLIYDYDKIYDSYDYTKPQHLYYGSPLLQSILKLTFKGLLQVIMSLLFTFVFIPLALIFLIIFAYSRYILRSIYDFITFQIIKCSARMPVREDNTAWRIKGPGVEKHAQYFFTLDDEDVFMLFQAQLERIQLENLKKTLQKEFKKPYQKAQKVFNEALSCLEVVRKDNFQAILTSQNILEQKLNNQIQHRYRSFPTLQGSYQVRFNDEELDRLIPLTTEQIHSFINHNNMNYVWKEYNVPEEDYKTLTDVLWKRVFNNEEILSALSECEEDYRHEIRKSVNDVEQDVFKEMNCKMATVQQTAGKWKRSSFNRTKRKQMKKENDLLQYQVSNFSGGLHSIAHQKNQMYQQQQQQQIQQQQIQVLQASFNESFVNNRALNKNKKKIKASRAQQYSYLEDEQALFSNSQDSGIEEIEDEMESNIEYQRQIQQQQQQEQQIVQNFNYSDSICKLTELELLFEQTFTQPSNLVSALSSRVYSIFLNKFVYNEEMKQEQK